MFALDDIKKYYLFRALNKRLALPVWVVIMVDNGLSVEQVALIAGVSALISLMLEVPSGTIADSIGHKRALTLALIGMGTGLLCFVGQSFWWFLIGSVLYYGTGSLMTGTHQAWLYERLQELGRAKDYQLVTGRARSFSSGVSLFAVILAGPLYLWIPALPFVISGLLYFLGAFTVSRFTANARKVSVQEREGWWQTMTHLKRSWNTLAKDPVLLWFMLCNALLFGSMLGAVEVQQVILKNVGLAVSLFGVIYAVKRLFSALVAPLLHRGLNWWTERRMVTLVAVSMFLYFVTLAFVREPWMLFIFVLFASFTFVMNDIVGSDLQNRRILKGSRATTLSMGNLFTGVVKVVSVGAVGILSATLSIEMVHLLLGGVTVVLIVGGFLLFPKKKNA